MAERKDLTGLKERFAILYDRSEGDRRVPESLKPFWLRRFGQHFLSVETSRLRQREILGNAQSEYLDPVAQLGNTMGVLSQSIRFYSPEDVEVFDTFLQTIRHFWLGMGYSMNEITREGKNDSQLFAEEVVEWLGMGFDQDVISGWFRAIRGVMCMDPTLIPQIFSPTGEIHPLAGGSYISRSMNKRRTLEERTVEIIREDRGNVSRILDRDKYTTLEWLTHFAESVSLELRGKSNTGLNQDLVSIADEAEMLARLLHSMGESDYKEIVVSRPTPVSELVIPIAVGIADFAKRSSLDERSARRLAFKLVNAVRSRRIEVSRQGILPFVAAFRSDGQVNRRILSSIVEGNTSIFGKGLKMVKNLLGSAYDSKEVQSWISNFVMPEFVLQLRVLGLHTFDWQLSDYNALGLQEESFDGHKRAVDRSAVADFPGRESVEKGDLVIEISGQFQPQHIGHLLLEWEAVNLRLVDLALSKLCQSYYRNLRVGIRVNSRSPTKADTQRPIHLRTNMVKRSLRGIPGVFIYPQDDVDLPTAGRFAEHQRWFKSKGRELAGPIIRLASAESRRFTEGISYPAIFALMIEDLANFGSLPDKMRRIFESSPHGAMILLVRTPEVHSSFIREKLKRIDPETLATLVHPSIVEDVYLNYGS